MPANTTRHDRPAWRLTDQGSIRNTWFVWCAFAVVICILVAVDPDKRSVTHNYREPSMKWWTGDDLYTPGIHGFLYFPHAAILYSPITWLPFTLGELAWRLISLAAMATGLWRLCKMTDPENHGRYFPLATILTLLITAGNARNGQMNLMLVALMLHAATDLGHAKWSRATASLLLATAFKPLGLVMLLLAFAACFRRLWWRMLIGIPALAIMPLVCRHPAYAWRQYQLLAHKLSQAADPHVNEYADIQGLLTNLLHIELPTPALTAIRLIAALIILAVSLTAVLKAERRHAAFMLYMLAAAYLMLFNPRTEGLSYVIIQPAIAILAAWCFFDARKYVFGTLFTLICVGIGLNYTLWGGYNYWFQPLLAIIFLTAALPLTFTNTITTKQPTNTPALNRKP